MKRIVVLLLLLVPVAMAQASPYDITNVTATATNQRVDISWDPPQDPVQGYRVYVLEEGRPFTNRTSDDTTESFLLTNGRSYVFQVAAVKVDGSEGPLSVPVAATPRLQNDLAYLAAGLIAVWVGIFGYAGFLARKENVIDKKLERILQSRFQGKSP